MDFDNLRNQVSNLTLYDLKAGVRKVQNAVMNLTEMESKVREATNADPWGAPSSLMMEIAQGTHNYQQLNEIMPMIYKRFTDKTAEEWRQIYKALQLLEFLVKNGSERVVDDARSHLSLLRMLRQFHFIDQNGKDQGINVRNRSSELAKLLSDVDAIRTERKKARSNRNKYGGVEGGAGIGGGFSGGSRYGGFGSESGNYGGYTGEVYGDGGGFGGQDPDFRFSGTQQRGDQFEEYDEAEEGGSPVTRPTKASSTGQVKRQTQPQKQKEPEQDLFDFSEEPATSSNNGALASKNGLDDFGTIQGGGAGEDDDFDDFQSATSPIAAPPSTTTHPLAAFSPPPTTSTTTSATQFAAPQPIAPAQAAPLNNILSAPSPAPSATSSVANTSVFTSPTAGQPAQPMQPGTAFKSSGPNYYTSVRADINTTPSGAPAAFSSRPTTTASQASYNSSTSAASLGKPANKAAAAKPAGDAFGSLWNNASNKAGVQAKTPATTRGPGMADMAKAKSAAGIWGAPAGASTGQRPGATNPTPISAATGGPANKPANQLGNGLDDLLG